MSDDDGGTGRGGTGGGGSRLLPILAFAIVVLLLAGGFLMFPRLQRAITFQDCVATGRTDCAPPGFTPR